MIPFTGETMTCVMCKCQQSSDPQVNSQWRLIEYEGQRFYVCPRHFPPDGASSQKFARAYQRVFRKIVSLVRQ